MSKIRAAVAAVLLVGVLGACQPQQQWTKRDKGSELHCFRYPNCPTTTTLDPPLHPF